MRQIFMLVHSNARLNALQAVKTAPEGYCVEVKPKTAVCGQC